ncbi:hypothetical protein [Arthrobacter sp.]|uniref:hypothetical protein n=1 Tax=Arthrobacter sp. TaxID=1667 RepID=UPI003391792C
MSRISDARAYSAAQSAALNTPGAKPVPATLKSYTDLSKGQFVSRFMGTFGIDESNVKSSALYQYGDEATLATGDRMPSGSRTHVLQIVVFTLNDDYAVDKAIALAAAKQQLSGQSPKPIGENGVYNHSQYAGVGKQRLVAAYYESTDDENSAKVLRSLGEEVDVSGILD